jgi:hypothetical protein
MGWMAPERHLGASKPIGDADAALRLSEQHDATV